MADNFPRPRLFFSRCLGFDTCRYNGQTIEDNFVKFIRDHVDCVTECPEMGIGLGCPREPIRLVEKNGDRRLVQPSTGKDVTEKMAEFCSTCLATLNNIDGLVLKFRSPSCGLSAVKIYSSIDEGGAFAQSAGMFGAAVLDTFPHLAISDEGRLKNYALREHFLTQIYTHARFRKVFEKGTMGALVDFHSRHKYLLMACNQSRLRNLGRMVANHDKLPTTEVFANYEKELGLAMSRQPRKEGNINALQHVMGYFKNDLTGKEKTFFIDALNRYRAEKIPFSVPLNVIRSWLMRLEEPYLEYQTFLQPFPEELVSVLDSGKGRPL